VVACGALSRPLLLVFRIPAGFDEASSSSSENRSIVLESRKPGGLLRLAAACLTETILLKASEPDRDEFDSFKTLLWADKTEAPFFRLRRRLSGN